MVNTILDAIDAGLSQKCWIETYGKQAILARRSVGGVQKRYPVSCDMLNACTDALDDHFNDLLPDTDKKGVAFWRLVSPITFIPAPGVSYNRNIKLATMVVDFIAWVNLGKALADSQESFCNQPDKVMLDAYKFFDCKKGNIPVSNSYINNLKIKVASIQDFEGWRIAMAQYSIDNLEALSMWPYTGFVIRLNISFMASSMCIPEFSCIECVDTITISYQANDVCTGTSTTITAITSPATTSILMYQWQQLINNKWVNIDDATMSTYTTDNLDAGEYTFRIKVTDCTCGGLYIGDPVVITSADHEFTIEATIDDALLCVGGTTWLRGTLIDCDSDVQTYEWQTLFDPPGPGAPQFVSIPGADTIDYQLSTDDLSENVYQYRLRATCGGCVAFSDPVSLTIEAQPDVFASADSNNIAPDGSANIFSEVDGGVGGINFQWQHFESGNWVDIIAANSSIYTVNGADWPLGGNDFRLHITQDAGCHGDSAPVTITIA